MAHMDVKTKKKFNGEDPCFLYFIKSFVHNLMSRIFHWSNDLFSHKKYCHLNRTDHNKFD